MSVNCFSKCGYSEASLQFFIDNGADAEFAGLQNFISEISPDLIIDYYLSQDEDAVTSVNKVDICPINWKEVLREKATRCVTDDDNKTNKTG